MNQKTRSYHKETATTVGTGLVINYPLNLVGLSLCMNVFGMTSAFYIGTSITIFMTFVAYVRVYTIRRYFDKRQ
jgi:uncharacterized membrane protein